MQHTKLICPCLQGSLIQARCFSCQLNTQKQHRPRQFHSSCCQCSSMQVCEYMCVAWTHCRMNSTEREGERERERGSPLQWRPEGTACQTASWQRRSLTGPSGSLWSGLAELDSSTYAYSKGLGHIFVQEPTNWNGGHEGGRVPMSQQRKPSLARGAGEG